MALRSQNFVTEPLSRLEMRNIVRQVDFIRGGDSFVYNLSHAGVRGRSGLEELESKSAVTLPPPLTGFFCSLLLTSLSSLQL